MTEKPKTRRQQHFRVPMTMLLGITSLLIAVVALAVSLFNLNTSNNNKDRMANFIQTQQTQLSAMAQQQTEAEQALHKALAKNDSNLKQLLQQVTNPSAEQAKSEARYLVRLASLNLHYANDVTTSLQLLDLAQHSVNRFHTEAVEILKRQISSDMQKLQQAPQIDKLALLNRLDQAQQLIKQISILPNVEAPKNKIKTTETKHNAHPWWQHAKHNLQSLKSLVVIRKFDNPTSLVLSPDNLLLTKEALIFKINQAQWAVLNNENALFQKSLATCLRTVGALNIQPEQKADLLKQLDELHQAKLYRYQDIHFSALPPTQES